MEGLKVVFCFVYRVVLTIALVESTADIWRHDGSSKPTWFEAALRLTQVVVMRGGLCSGVGGHNWESVTVLSLRVAGL